MSHREDLLRLGSLSEARAYIKNVEFGDELVSVSQEERVTWIHNLLSQFDYHSLGREDKGVLRKVLEKATGYSRAQVTRHIQSFQGAPREMVDEVEPAKTTPNFKRLGLLTSVFVVLGMVAVQSALNRTAPSLMFLNGEVQENWKVDPESAEQLLDGKEMRRTRYSVQTKTGDPDQDAPLFVAEEELHRTGDAEIERATVAAVDGESLRESVRERRLRRMRNRNISIPFFSSPTPAPSPAPSTHTETIHTQTIIREIEAQRQTIFDLVGGGDEGQVFAIINGIPRWVNLKNIPGISKIGEPGAGRMPSYGGHSAAPSYRSSGKRGGGGGGGSTAASTTTTTTVVAADSGWTDDGSVVRLTAIDDLVGVGTTTPETKMEVVGTISGAIVDAASLLRSSGALIVETTGLFHGNLTSRGTLSGANLTVMAGADSYILGDVGIGTTSPSSALEIIGTASGRVLHAESSLRSSGTLLVEGDANIDGNTLFVDASLNRVAIAQAAADAALDVAGTISGSTVVVTGVADCNNGNTLKTNAAGEIVCATDEGGSGSSSKWTDLGSLTYLTGTSDDVAIGGSNANAPFVFDVSEKSLKAVHVSGATLHAETSITVSGALVWEGAASGSSIYIANTLEGAGLTDCDSATATLNWDSTTKRFSCGTDSDTTYTAGAGIEMDGTTFRLVAAITGSTLHAITSLTTSGTLVFEGAASGASLTVSDGFDGSGLTDCDSATATLNWDATTKRFSCGTDSDTTYAAGAGVEMDGTTFRLANAITGSTLHAITSLTTSGTLVFEGAASGKSLYLADTIEGAGLYTDCDGSANKVTWDLTTKRFKCESDQNDNTTYQAGAGIEMDGTTFRLVAAITGSTLHAITSLTTSGTLVFEGAASGASLTVSDGFDGSGLTDCDSATATLNWDATTKRFSCGTDSDTTYAAGQGVGLNGTVFSLNSAITGSTVHAIESISTSGSITFDGTASGRELYIAGTIEGAGLYSDCDGTSNKITWDADTRRFKCESDQNTGTTYAAGQGITLQNTIFSLNSAISGSTIHALESISTSGSITFDGTASGNSLYIANTIEGAGLNADCDGTSNKITWDADTRQFKCESDQNTGTTYAAGEGITLQNGVFSLNENITGATLGLTGNFSTSGSIVFNGNASGNSLYIANTIQGAGLNADCDGTSNKITWDADTMQFKCESDQNTGTTYAAGQGLTLDGTVFSLTATITGTSLEILGTLSGHQIYARDSLASSGTLVFEGAASGQSLYLADTIEGAGLYTDCDGSSNKVTWDLTTKRFKCESDQNDNTTYQAGAGIEMDGTTFRLAAAITGSTLHAITSLTTSGTLVFEGAASGASLYVANGFSGSGLTDCDSASSTLNWDSTTQRFSCGTDADTDTDTTYTAGANLALDGTTFRLASNLTASTLDVLGTLSGFQIYGRDSLASSGTLVFEGAASGSSLYLGNTFEGAGLASDCDGSANKVTWDLTTKRFKCESDQNDDTNTTYTAGANLALNGTTFRLASNLTAATLDVHGTLSGFQIYARDSLASSGTLVFEGAASGKSLYLADTIEGAGLYSDCDGSSNKVTWDITTKRFKCESDENSGTTYAAGAGITLDGTTFRLANAITGSTLHAITSLTTSGTLVWEGAASGASLYLGNSIEGAGLVSDCDSSADKIIWDATSKRFSCGTDLNTGGASFEAGAGLALDGTTFRLANTITAATLEVIGTLSGFQIYARDSLASSGALVFEGAASGKSLYLADTIEGAGLYADCDGTSNKVTWDLTTKRFKCESDENSGSTYVAGAGLEIDDTTFRLAANVTGSTLHAITSLTTSGTLVFEGAASGSSLYLGSTFEGAGLASDCDGSANKVTWDVTTKRFKCESDQDSGTAYTAGANLALDGTTFRLAANITGSTLHAITSLTTSGTLVWEGAASGASLTVSDGFDGSGLTDCDGAADTLNWDSTTKRFSCGTDADTDTDTTYAAGAGLTLDGTTFRLAANITGSTLHAITSLTTSGTLVFEGAASGSSLYLGSTFEGAGLASDCDGSANKVTWDVTTKRFKCESDQDSGTAYTAGANLALDGTTFRLASNLTASTLDVLGTLSGFQIYARDSLASSGTLVFEGAASGKSLYLADTIEGAGLYADCDGTANKITWDITTKRFKCESDENTDTNTTYTAGANLALDGTNFRLASNLTASTLDVHGTLSGFQIYARDSLASSGTIVFEGAASGKSLYLANTIEGAGLYADCDGTSNKVVWDLTTKRFGCETDQTGGGGSYAAGAGLALDGTTFRLAANITGSTIHAITSLTTSGTLVFEGAASGSSLYLGDTFQGAGLASDCDGTSNKVTWDLTTKRFKCETDQTSEGGGGSYYAGAGLEIDGTTFRLSSALTGVTITAATALTSSGTLDIAGYANFRDTLSGKVIHAEESLTSSGTLHVTLTGSFAGNIVPNLGTYGTMTYADSGSDGVGTYSAIDCPTEDDCKIVTYNSTDTALEFIDCDNSTCSSRTITQLQGGSVGGGFMDIDCPTADDCKISYMTSSSYAAFLDCNDATCSSPTQNDLESTGIYSATAIDCPSATDCKVMWIDTSGGDIQFADCNDASCSSPSVNALTSSLGLAPAGDEVYVLDMDCPSATDCKLVYMNSTTLEMIDCDSADCTTNTDTTIDSSGSATGYVSIDCPSATDCKIAYYYSSSDLYMADCDNATCSSKTLTAVHTAGTSGLYTDIACPATDNCKIVMEEDTNSDLLFVDCENATCSSSNVVSIDTTNTGTYNGISCPSSTTCRIASEENSNTDQNYYACDGETCTKEVDLGTSGKFFKNVYANTYYGKNTTVQSFDVAENYPTSDTTLAAGDVVSLTGSGMFIGKSTGAYNSKILGVVSTDPGLLLANWEVPDSHPQRPVALSGRIPTKVSTENGSISVGDYLTSSSITGVAMKATAPGPVLGIALDDYSSVGVGKIEVFVQGFYKSSGDIDYSSGAVIRTAQTEGSDDAFVIISQAGEVDNTIFRVTASGAVHTDGPISTTGADYAEWFKMSGERLAVSGQLVCIDPTEENSVKLCDRDGDPNVMGIVSTNPAFIGNQISGADGVTPPGHVLVGLIGQVPAKVVVGSGAVRPGDALTAGETPGTARIARPGEPTVGIALEGTEVDGTVNVLISRRNSSVTVETVEESVLETIADMEIEDEVEIMVSDAIENLDVDDEIALEVESQIAELDLHTATEETLRERLTNLGFPVGFGSGMTVSSTLRSRGQAIFEDAVTLQGPLTVSGGILAHSAAFGGEVSVASNLFIDKSLDVDGAITAGSLVVKKDLYVGGTLHTSALAASGSVLAGNTVINGTLTINGRVFDPEATRITTGSTLDLSSLRIRDAITILGDITVSGLATFLENLHVEGEFSVNERQAGYAVIPQTGTSVTVTFEPEFDRTPIVTASPDTPVQYGLTVATETGFTLHIADPAEEKITFSWVALISPDADTVVGARGGEVQEELTEFPVDAHGVPTSSNIVWNACIRNQVVLDANGQPYNCSRYREGNIWRHPDLEIDFTWDSESSPRLSLPAGLITVQIIVEEEDVEEVEEVEDIEEVEEDVTNVTEETEVREEVVEEEAEDVEDVEELEEVVEEESSETSEEVDEETSNEQRVNELTEEGEEVIDVTEGAEVTEESEVEEVTEEESQETEEQTSNEQRVNELTEEEGETDVTEETEVTEEVVEETVEEESSETSITSETSEEVVEEEEVTSEDTEQ